MKKDPDPISAAELSRQFSGDESSTSATYGRVSSFREKLATEGLKRYEVYVSDKTKKSIKSIARQEEISTGVAAEALLKLGIEAYERLSSPQAVVDPAPDRPSRSTILVNSPGRSLCGCTSRHPVVALIGAQGVDRGFIARTPVAQ
jgi:hypothetical protein